MMRYRFKYPLSLENSSLILKNATLGLLCFILTACSTNIPSHDREPVLMGKLQGYKKELVKGGDFLFTSFQKITDKNQPYVFYIEGDGVSYINKRKISDNPTPYPPMLIRLAALDTRPNVVYIARPCQYTPMHLNPKCTKTYWTNKTYSEEVVQAMNQAIERINNGQRFSLIGFSGGGAIAILIAARNHNVKDIITIAGNLDHRAVYQYHNAPPLIGSLNPIDYAGAVKNIPQLHLSGGNDKVVTVLIADKFVQAVNSICAHQYIIPEATHTKGWINNWQYIVEDFPLACYKG